MGRRSGGQGDGSGRGGPDDSESSGAGNLQSDHFFGRISPCSLPNAYSDNRCPVPPPGFNPATGRMPLLSGVDLGSLSSSDPFGFEDRVRSGLQIGAANGQVNEPDFLGSLCPAESEVGVEIPRDEWKSHLINRLSKAPDFAVRDRLFAEASVLLGESAIIRSIHKGFGPGVVARILLEFSEEVRLSREETMLSLTDVAPEEIFARLQVAIRRVLLADGSADALGRG